MNGDYLDPRLDLDDAEPAWVMRCPVRCVRDAEREFLFELQAIDFGTGWPQIHWRGGEVISRDYICTLGGPMGVQHLGPWLDLAMLRPVDLKLLREGHITDALLAEAQHQIPIRKPAKQCEN